MRYSLEKHGRKLCSNCCKVMPKEHFIQKVNKNGKTIYYCNVVQEKRELSRNNKKRCSYHGTMEKLDHFIQEISKNGKILFFCKEALENRDNKLYLGSRKGKKQPRTKSLQYELDSPEYLRDRYLENRFGITLDDYNKMFESQNGCCAICGRHQSEFKKNLCVDHCHYTSKVRGLLCIKCNKALGHFYDSIELLESAKSYVEKY